MNVRFGAARGPRPNAAQIAISVLEADKRPPTVLPPAKTENVLWSEPSLATLAPFFTAAQLAQEADAASDTTKKMVEAGNVSALELTRRQIEASAAKVALMAANLEAQTAAGALEDAMQSPLR